MKLSTDLNGRVIIIDGNKIYSMARYAKKVRGDAKLACTALETAAGIDHPKWYDLERGKYESVKPFLVGLEFLGYSVEINKEGSE